MLRMCKFKLFVLSLFIAISGSYYCYAAKVSSDSSKYMKYEVRSGIIKYKVSLVDKDKKEVELYNLEVAFNNYGSEEMITWYNKDSIKFYYKSEENQKKYINSVELSQDRTWDVYTELLVADTKSWLYKGAIFFKGNEVKYLRKKCIKFLHFQFEKLKISGKVIFYKGIPLKIRLWDNGQIYIIEAYEVFLNGPDREPVVSRRGGI